MRNMLVVMIMLVAGCAGEHGAVRDAGPKADSRLEAFGQELQNTVSVFKQHHDRVPTVEELMGDGEIDSEQMEKIGVKVEQIRINDAGMVTILGE